MHCPICKKEIVDPQIRKGRFEIAGQPRIVLSNRCEHCDAVISVEIEAAEPTEEMAGT